jgi:hypothetical protein
MAKGMRVKLNYAVSRDPDTGAEITRLTPPEVTCHRNYFYQKCFLTMVATCCSPASLTATGTTIC